MSLKTMHENRRNSLESSQSNPEPVILPEHLIERLAEAQKALEQEQELRVQAEQRAEIETEKNKTLQRLLTELSETSDSEMPTKLREQLKKKDEQLSNEQEQKEKLKKQLQKAAATAYEDKKASDKRISQLETDKSDLERKLRYERFDKKAFLQGLESREQKLKDGQNALRVDKADFEGRVRIKAQEKVQTALSEYEAKKAKCEAEKQAVIDEYTQLKTDEETIIQKSIDEHKAELDEQAAQERAEHDRQHEKREKELDRLWKLRNTALTAKFATISGLIVIGGLIGSIVTVINAIISFTHGLLPFIIEDGKEIGNWIGNDWNAIFGQAFVFPNTLLPITQLALPLIFLIIIGIWTAFNFDEHKWVVFASKVSIIFISTGIGISAVFGKQLSEILGFNTVMFPIAVYLLYVLFRWLWEIGALQGLGKILKWLALAPIKWWKGLAPNEKGATVWFVMMAVVIICAFKSCAKEN